jgi:hypothetical protein
MPIRLNLLAEAQAAEELRRRDPVKRALWVAALLVALLLVWSSSLQLRAIMAKSSLAHLETQMSAHTNEYQLVLNNRSSTDDIRRRLAALSQLATNRFLNGMLLNALQQCSVPDLQLTRLRVDQTYSLVEGTRSRTNEEQVVVKGRPSTATEKILVTLDGVDTSPSQGGQVSKFKEVIATNAYFRRVLQPTNAVALKSLSAPQISPDTGKACVFFQLECRYPEKTR